MKEVLDFLNKQGVFFVSSIENNKPKVRPMGFVMEYDSKLYFCTSNKKNMFKQLSLNPNIEISAANAQGEWLRIEGNVVFNNDVNVKNKIFELSEFVAGAYKSVDNPDFEVFYLDNVQATFASFTTKPRTVEL